MHRRDHVLLDNLAYDSLRQGAAASGATVEFFRHLDNDAVRRHLAGVRATDTKNADLVVTEGVFSIDSDTPRLAELLGICREYDAKFMVDVAHDFGALGEDGTGQLGLQGILDEVDFVVGAFSKSFATTGGFLATRSASVHEFVRVFGGPQTSSSALTPVQTAVAGAALGIIRSPEGAVRRKAVAAVAQRLRDGLEARGHRTRRRDLSGCARLHRHHRDRPYRLGTHRAQWPDRPADRTARGRLGRGSLSPPGHGRPHP
jgi:glycine C-acetyltransferase